MGVVDIQFDVPRAADTVFIDTNVWLFAYYEKTTFNVSRARQQAIDWYLRYLGRLGSVSATLVTLPTVLLEIQRTIEHEEYTVECERRGIQPFSDALSLKQWRESPASRDAVYEATTGVWSEVSQRADVRSVELEREMCQDVLEMTHSQSIDAFDAMHISRIRSLGVSQVLSDDIDFVSVGDLVLLTKNQRALSRAAELGVLVRR